MDKFSINDYIRMAKARGVRLPIQYFFQNHLFDLLHKTNTHTRLEKKDYEEHPKDFDSGVLYMSSVTCEIKKALRIVKKLAGNAFADYQYFDLGCGKGKSILVYALKYGKESSHRAVGIEYYKPLADVATNNFDIAGIKGKAISVNGDAREYYKYCTSHKIIIYLYNPFGAEVLDDILKSSINRDVYIIYTDPAHSKLIIENGFKQVYDKTGPFPNRNTSIFFRPKSL